MAIYINGQVGWFSGITPPSLPLLLDTYTGATVAYSLRKLRNAYAGSAIRVRRSNDNTTLDVGFDASGNLDTTSLLSFVGGVNQIQYSEEFDNAYWGKLGVTVTANNTTAPDGTMTADLITETVSNSYHTFGRTGGSGTWASGTSYNTSVYIKRTTDVNSPTRVALAFDYGTSALKPYVIFNIENGTVESYNFFTDINTGYSITDSGNGWWRISMWGTLTASRSSFESGGLIRFNNNLSTISTTQYTPLSGSGVYLWGYQLTKLGTDLQPYSKTTTLTAGNGFVSIWYDQSGNGRNAVQATAANQPQIVTGGVVNSYNSKPCVKFDGSNDFIESPYATGTLNELYFVTQTTDTNFLFPRGVSGYGFVATQNSTNTLISNYYTTQPQLYVNSILSTPTNRGAIYNLLNGYKLSLHKGADISFNFNYLRFGSFLQDGTLDFNGNLLEWIIYPTLQSSQSSIESNINTYYTIY